MFWCERDTHLHVQFKLTKQNTLGPSYSSHVHVVCFYGIYFQCTFKTAIEPHHVIPGRPVKMNHYQQCF